MTILLESDTVELKVEWTARVFESVAALANTEGGWVLLGVRDDGTVKGFDVSDKNQRDISGRIADKLRFNVPLHVLEQDGKTILEMVVPCSSVLVAYEGRYLIRVGTTNRDMTPAEIQNRALRNSGQSWDALVAPGTWPGSVSDEAVEERVRQTRFRFELGMELHRDEPRMCGDLDRLDQLSIRADSAQTKPRG